jgi:hypothetical protein
MKHDQKLNPAESEIFWLAAPSDRSKNAPKLADSTGFSAAIAQVCEEANYQVIRFVSAKGAYGTWLVELKRDAVEQRVVWNGKDKKLVLQLRRSEGGWDDTIVISISPETLESFARGVKSILSPGVAAEEQGLN